MYQEIEDLKVLNCYKKQFIKEWVEHFLSVSNINGIYEGEFWDVINVNDYWNIIGKNGFVFTSKLNNHKEEYYDPGIILRELMFLEPSVADWFKEYIEKKDRFFKDIPKEMIRVIEVMEENMVDMDPKFVNIVDEEFWELL